MKNKHLIIFLLLLSVLTANAQNPQRKMYICHSLEADTYQVSDDVEVNFINDSIWIRQQSFLKADVDSIVFREPFLDIRKSGWWGELEQGSSYYVFHKRNQSDGNVYKPYIYDILFSFEAADNICLSAACELRFPEKSMMQNFLHDYDPSNPAINPVDPGEDDNPGGDDGPGQPGGSGSYVNVKQTETGTRRFEVWQMGDPILPVGRVWIADGNTLKADCTIWLKDRQMNEVQIIVEAWIHQ